MKKATKPNAVGIGVEKHTFSPEEDIKNVLEGSYRTHLVHVLSGSQSHWLCSAVIEDLVGVSVSAFTT